MDGPNAHVVDQLLGNDHRKRSRPTATSSASSSLDYHKPEDADSLVTPGQLPEQQQQEEEQFQQQQMDDSRPKISTRARGSSGIPPRGKLQLEDLQGMSEHEITRALYEDPELAAAAAAAAPPVGNDKPNTESSTRSSTTSEKSSSKKTPAGKRVDGLKERGFPFVQWAVILLLLGFAIYRIYKSMVGTSTKARNKKPIKIIKSKSTKTAKHGTGNPKTQAPVVTDDTEEIVMKEPAPQKETKPVIQAKAAKKNGSDKPVLKKKKVKGKKTKVTSSSEEDDIAPAASAALSPQTTRSIVTETNAQDDGWTTVRKDSDSKPKIESSNEPPALVSESADVEPMHEDTQASNDLSFEKNSEAPELVSETADVVPLHEDAQTAVEIDEIQTMATKSKNNKKKKKKMQANGESATQENDVDDIGVDGDEALAMELQQFEQRSVQRVVDPNTDDVWEEVKAKKRK